MPSFKPRCRIYFQTGGYHSRDIASIFRIMMKRNKGYHVFALKTGRIMNGWLKTHVCSVSNVPFAPILWENGIPFGCFYSSSRRDSESQRAIVK